MRASRFLVDQMAPPPPAVAAVTTPPPHGTWNRPTSYGPRLEHLNRLYTIWNEHKLEMFAKQSIHGYV